MFPSYSVSKTVTRVASLLQLSLDTLVDSVTATTREDQSGEAVGGNYQGVPSWMVGYLPSSLACEVLKTALERHDNHQGGVEYDMFEMVYGVQYDMIWCIISGYTV